MQYITDEERKERRGFASMDPDKQREIASKGGKAVHQKGTGHQWTSEEAREAGRKGGMTSRRRKQTLTQFHDLDGSIVREEREGGVLKSLCIWSHGDWRLWNDVARLEHSGSSIDEDRAIRSLIEIENRAGNPLGAEQARIKLYGSPADS